VNTTDRVGRKKFDYVLKNVPSIELMCNPTMLTDQRDGVPLFIDVQNVRKGVAVDPCSDLEDRTSTKVIGTATSSVRDSRIRLLLLWWLRMRID